MRPFTIQPLKIEPVSHLQHQRPVFGTRILKELVGVIIVGINQEDIGYWPEAPLQTAIDVDVVGLGIVLQKGAEEKTTREG